MRHYRNSNPRYCQCHSRKNHRQNPAGARVVEGQDDPEQTDDLRLYLWEEPEAPQKTTGTKSLVPKSKECTDEECVKAHKNNKKYSILVRHMRSGASLEKRGFQLRAVVRGGSALSRTTWLVSVSPRKKGDGPHWYILGKPPKGGLDPQGKPLKEFRRSSKIASNIDRSVAEQEARRLAVELNAGIVLEGKPRGTPKVTNILRPGEVGCPGEGKCECGYSGPAVWVAESSFRNHLEKQHPDLAIAARARGSHRDQTCTEDKCFYAGPGRGDFQEAFKLASQDPDLLKGEALQRALKNKGFEPPERKSFLPHLARHHPKLYCSSLGCCEDKCEYAGTGCATRGGNKIEIKGVVSALSAKVKNLNRGLTGEEFKELKKTYGVSDDVVSRNYGINQIISSHIRDCHPKLQVKCTEDQCLGGIKYNNRIIKAVDEIRERLSEGLGVSIKKISDKFGLNRACITKHLEEHHPKLNQERINQIIN